MQSKDDFDSIPVLPENIPVAMPDLPVYIVISTVQQLKAISDPVRSRILGIIQNQPATAKQIADTLEASPGAIGHHMHVLESAGLAQVVARRLVRGIVANYYTRTARIFKYDLPREIIGDTSVNLDIMSKAYEEHAETEANEEEDVYRCVSFPHVRLSQQRAMYYSKRIQELVDDLLHEQPDTEGTVYGVMVSMFRSPGYMQSLATNSSIEPKDTGKPERKS